MCWNTFVFGVFEHQPKFAKKWPKRMITFTFCKTQVHKKSFLLQPPFWPKIGVFQLVFWKRKNIDVEQNYKLKSGKTKIRKRDLKEKARQETKKEKLLMKKTLQFNILMLFLSWNKSKEERNGKKETKTRNQKKARKKDTKEEQMTRTRERQRKRNWKRGRPNKAKEKQRETLKIQRKMPFSRGKNTSFLY